jgi:hypothetical protein
MPQVTVVDDQFGTHKRDWGTAYFGTNLPRLRAAAAAYDPDRVLDFPQNVQRT